MKKILIHSAFILIAAIVPQLAMAQVAITEIMYDPSGSDSGHEWIEVYDEGSSSVPLTSWKVSEGDSNHGIYSTAGAASSMLAPATYAVIAANAARFQTDYPEFSGELFHASLSLSNSGETVTLRDASKAAIDSVSYDSAWGGKGDGNSLQRAPGDTGSFAARSPTPGFEISSAAIPAKTAALAAPADSSGKATKEAAHASEVKPRTSRTKTKTSAPSAYDAASSDDAGNMAIVNGQPAASARATGILSSWWAALAGMLFATIAAIAIARHYAKSEWDIIEENPEDVYSDMI